MPGSLGCTRQPWTILRPGNLPTLHSAASKSKHSCLLGLCYTVATLLQVCSRKNRQRVSSPERTAAGHLGSRQPLEVLDLDEEALENVLLALPPASLAVAACVSQGLRIASESESLWEKHCIGRWLHPHKHLRQGAAKADCISAGSVLGSFSASC